MQNEEYLVRIPSHKTTEALCYRLKGKKHEFSGISRTLSPYNDAISLLMKAINMFCENTFEIKINCNDESQQIDNALSEDFIIDRIKNDFSEKISQFFYNLLIIFNVDNWNRLYLDGGDGVKTRRALAIFKTLEGTLANRTFKNQSNIGATVYNIFCSAVDSIIGYYGYK